MRVKSELIKGILLGVIVPLGFIVLTLIVGLIWYILLKYFDFLLGIFPESIFLTSGIFCATIGTIIFGGYLYVSSR